MNNKKARIFYQIGYEYEIEIVEKNITNAKPIYQTLKGE